MRYKCTTRTARPWLKRFTGQLSESCEGLSQAARFLYVTTVPWLDNISPSIRDISHVSKGVVLRVQPLHSILDGRR